MMEIDGIRGHLVAGDICFLHDLALVGDRILEIGSFLGLSATIMLGFNPDATMVCVDTWNSNTANEIVDDDYYRQFKRNIAQRKMTTRVEIIQKYSSEIVPFLVDDSFDAAWIDGSHKNGDCYKDMAAVWPKIKVGGIMAGHDATRTKGCEVTENINRFCCEKRITSKIHQGTAGAWSIAKQESV